MSIILVIITFFLVGFYFWYKKHRKKHRKVVSASHIVVTYLKKKGNMEQYNITWTLSPSTFVEKQQLFAGLDGGVAAQVGADMPSSQSSVLAEFSAGAKVDLFIKVVGDNATEADSVHVVPFTVANAETVAPATSVSATWVKHIS